MSRVQVEIEEFPDPAYVWMCVRRRALITQGLEHIVNAPWDAWKHDLLEARHSPIRRLWFSFRIHCPYWVSVHLCRHVHAQPYVQSQRNDRQDRYDRNTAPQDQPVVMIWDLNAEELMTVANKRLCNKAQPETREVVQKMCDLVLNYFPEFTGLLVPACQYNGVCHEIKPCGAMDTRKGE